jgi:hypothetical protein
MVIQIEDPIMLKIMLFCVHKPHEFGQEDEAKERLSGIIRIKFLYSSERQLIAGDAANTRISDTLTQLKNVKVDCATLLSI